MLLYNMKTLDFDLVVNKMSELYNLGNYGVLLDSNIVLNFSIYSFTNTVY